MNTNRLTREAHTVTRGRRFQVGLRATAANALHVPLEAFLRVCIHRSPSGRQRIAARRRSGCGPLRVAQLSRAGGSSAAPHGGRGRCFPLSQASALKAPAPALQGDCRGHSRVAAPTATHARSALETDSNLKLRAAAAMRVRACASGIGGWVSPFLALWKRTGLIRATT